MNALRIRMTAAGICLLPAAGALAGCSSSHTVGPTKLEQAITQQAQGVKLPLSDVTCPGSIDAKVGNKFTCTAKSGTITVTYGVVIDSIKGSTVHFNFKPLNPIVDLASIQTQMVQQIGAGSSVDCGPPVTQLPAGAQFTCTATLGTDTQQVTLKVNDDGSASPVTTTTTPGASASATTPSPGSTDTTGSDTATTDTSVPDTTTGQ